MQHCNKYEEDYMISRVSKHTHLLIYSQINIKVDNSNKIHISEYNILLLERER